jgi:hypothetical protein
MTCRKPIANILTAGRPRPAKTIQDVNGCEKDFRKHHYPPPPHPMGACGACGGGWEVVTFPEIILTTIFILNSASELQFRCLLSLPHTQMPNDFRFHPRFLSFPCYRDSAFIANCSVGLADDICVDIHLCTCFATGCQGKRKGWESLSLMAGQRVFACASDGSIGDSGWAAVYTGTECKYTTMHDAMVCIFTNLHWRAVLSQFALFRNTFCFNCCIKVAHKQWSEGHTLWKPAAMENGSRKGGPPCSESRGHLFKALGKVSFSHHPSNIRPSFVGLLLHTPDQRFSAPQVFMSSQTGHSNSTSTAVRT